MEFSISLVFHIITGSIAVIAGVIALFVKKGKKTHRQSGRWFFYSMILMAITGAILSIILSMPITFIGSVLTIYLIVSSWTLVKNPPNTIRQYDYIYPVVGLTIAAISGYFAYQANLSPDGLYYNYPAGPYLFMAVPASIATLFDIRMLITKGLKGPSRLARHLWRMCFSLFIAIGSFMEQGLKSIDLSQYVDQWLIDLPSNIIILATVFYLVKVHLGKWLARKRLPEAT
ncbi:hypothetical protein [Agaribacter marinus]|uniref:DUF2306 domain-containing protein n=1 Tax=Agaribacter marinus TaxID=1431249 RepID=A0AA37WFU7_9ALTE|nr:hypothetical protein [Agaribacter marinus]GLR69346.1 hypothetical protein GCM10007852_02540 [Agaribacter marinus]